MSSSRMMQPALSSPARTRPSSTCSLNATTRSVRLPPFVTGPGPMRMRLPLAPATLRAGGRISAGMISTVQMPLPERAAIEPSDWPQRCAPSPESLMTSTICSCSVSMFFMPRISCPYAREVALRDAEDRCGAGGVDAEVALHAARGFPAGAHRLDDGGGPGHDVAAGEDASHRGGELVVGVDVAALAELQLRGLADDRVGVGADRVHHDVDRELELAALHRQRAAAAGLVGLAELHPDAAQRADIAFAVVQDPDRIGEPVELDALLLSVMELFRARRALGPTAPVD